MERTAALTNRSSWDDYVELMTLLPEGNRQIAAAIGTGFRKLACALKRRWRHAADSAYRDQGFPRL